MGQIFRRRDLGSSCWRERWHSVTDSDDTRENEPQALPNVDVFAVSQLEINYNIANLDHAGKHDHQAWPCWPCCTIVQAGWYWWSCFPGCMPDGEPFGPFVTEADAIADAKTLVLAAASQAQKAADHILTEGGK
jgi:hypothetical protein